MISYTLPHKIDTGPARHNWLWYSHGTVARGEVPTDRQVVSGWQDPNRAGIRMAGHYFLTDMAHRMLAGGYHLTPLPDQRWQLDINSPREAAMFKLTFM